MKIPNKLKSYKFWVSLSSAIILFIQTLGNELGFHISEQTISGIVTAFCGILVVLGFIKDDRFSSDAVDNKKEQSKKEEKIINSKEDNSLIENVIEKNIISNEKEKLLSKHNEENTNNINTTTQKQQEKIDD